MAIFPDAAVADALRNAAEQERVPLSLLMAVAFAETGFDTTKTSSAGAQGLMQLMPATQRKYGVTDPFDAQQSAIGAAKILAALAKATQWNRAAMLAAYRSGSASRPSAATARYVKRAESAAYYYQLQAEPQAGATFMQRLDAAIERLAADNPTYTPATLLREEWRFYFKTYGKEPDEHSQLRQGAKDLWSLYQRAYERAPIDIGSPHPKRVEPNINMTMVNDLALTQQQIERFLGWTYGGAKKVLSDLAEPVGKAALGVGAGLFVLAVFWVWVNADRRSSF